MSGDIPNDTDVRWGSPRGPRQVAVRSQVAQDVAPIVASDDYSAADLVARASADWGPAFNVAGRDRVQLWVEFVSPANDSVLGIAIQSCHTQDDVAPGVDEDWYDWSPSVLQLGDGVALLDAADADLLYDPNAATTARVVVEIPAIGNFMRVKPYASTGTTTASRATIKVTRVQKV